MLRKQFEETGEKLKTDKLEGNEPGREKLLKFILCF